jgi:integrase
VKERQRGMGSIYQRAGVYWIKYYAGGKPFRESTGERGKEGAKAAKDLLKKRLGEMGVGAFIGPQAERVTFEELTELVRADYKSNGRKSLWRAEMAVTRLGDHFAGMKALSIPTRAQAYIVARLAEKASAATIRYELAILGRAFTLAFQSRLLPQRPFIPTLEVRNVRQGFFEEKELRAVLKHLPETVRPVVEFAYLTGWRRGEVLSLEWRQIDFQAGTVRLEPGTTKNDEGRTFPFAAIPALAALLQAQREYTTAVERERQRIIPWVFHRRGFPMVGIRGEWERACDKAKVPGRLFHDLRRTAVRNLERAGVPRSVAMKLTGHKTEAVYRRYAIVSESDLSAGVRKLAGVLDAESAATGTERAQIAGSAESPSA